MFNTYQKARDDIYQEKLRVAKLVLKFNPKIDLLNDKDSQGNNFLHFITQNYLKYTIRKFLLLEKILNFTTLESKDDVKKKIVEMASEKNNQDVSPIDMALSMVYSERLFYTVKFLIEEGKVYFETQLEDRAMNHLVDIFRFNESDFIKKEDN